MELVGLQDSSLGAGQLFWLWRGIRMHLRIISVPEGIYYRGRFRAAVAWSKVGKGGGKERGEEALVSDKQNDSFRKACGKDCRALPSEAATR